MHSSGFLSLRSAAKRSVIMQLAHIQAARLWGGEGGISLDQIPTNSRPAGYFGFLPVNHQIMIVVKHASEEGVK